MSTSEKRIQTIKNLVEIAESEKADYFDTVHAIALVFPANLREQLTQLVSGPIWDGNIINKSDRAELFDMGIAIRVCCSGEQGHTGARYIGFSILKKMAELERAS